MLGGLYLCYFTIVKKMWVGKYPFSLSRPFMARPDIRHIVFVPTGYPANMVPVGHFASFSSNISFQPNIRSFLVPARSPLFLGPNWISAFFF